MGLPIGGYKLPNGPRWGVIRGIRSAVIGVYPDIEVYPDIGEDPILGYTSMSGYSPLQYTPERKI